MFIPGPLIAIGTGYALTQTVLADSGLTVSLEKYGAIPTADFFKLAPLVLPPLNATLAFDFVYYVTAIVFVAAIESLLCSRMADRLAENEGTP